jgi:hypothetical protein
MIQCLLCSNPADGLDDEHCQDHWEEICNNGFWEMIQKMESAFQWKLAIDKARSLHPDFDSLPL